MSLYRSHRNLVAEKWSHYPVIYDELFLPLYRQALEIERKRQQQQTNDDDQNIIIPRPRMLEIGIGNGGSLQIHSNYFHGLVDITGMDINPVVARVFDETELGNLPNIFIVIGNATDYQTILRVFGSSPEYSPPNNVTQEPELHPTIVEVGSDGRELNVSHIVTVQDSLKPSSSSSSAAKKGKENLEEEEEAQEGDPFDVIIDDGSHINMEVLLTFNFLFPYVKPGGMYIIENIHTSFIVDHYNGGMGVPATTIEYFKRLADRINLHPMRDALLHGMRIPKEHYDQEVYMRRWIRSIEIVDSLIVIRKLFQPKPDRGLCRLIVGDIELVTKLQSNLTWIPNYSQDCLSRNYEL